MATWNVILKSAARGDQIVAKAPNDEQVWEAEFNCGFGIEQGQPVLAWSATRVYFPVKYDGSECIESAPRNPQQEGQAHVGGG